MFGFCLKPFRRKLFVIGERNVCNLSYTKACLKIYLKQDKWSYIASMNVKDSQEPVQF